MIRHRMALAGALFLSSLSRAWSGTVIFNDDFESGNLSVFNDGVDPARHHVIDDPTGQGHGKVLEMKFLLPGGDGGYLGYLFGANYDEAYVDFDVYFPSNWQGFTKLMAFYGSQTTNPYSALGQAGHCPTGEDFFAAMVVMDHDHGFPDPQPYRFYNYYPEMAREPDGVTCWGRYGPSATSTTHPLLGQWNHLRLYVKLNSPGGHDGLEQLSLNGSLFSEWLGISFGDTSVLKLNSIQITGSSSWTVERVLYFDNVRVTLGAPGALDGQAPAPPRRLALR